MPHRKAKKTGSRRGRRRRAAAERRIPSLYYYDRAAAERACEFFPRFLVHTKGEWAGKPFELEEWQQREIIRPAFGWKRRADGTRRYRLVYIEVPRKNGKSQLAAGIGLYLLLCDGEPGAEIYSAAADRGQAGIVFQVAADMARASPEIASQVEIYRRRLFVPATLSYYEVLSADVETKHGLNPHGILFDELHVQDNRELWDVLRSGRGARRQPLTVVMTTAGYRRDSICREQHDRARAIFEHHAQDDTVLPVIYGIREQEDWKDPEVWRRVNPNLGVSIQESFLREEFQEASESPAYENTFRRYYLCEWVEQVTRWINMEKWQACAGRRSAEDLAQSLRGKPCWAGLDLSTVTDLSAFVLVFESEVRADDPDYPPEDQVGAKATLQLPPGLEYGDPLPVYDVLCWFWCPEEGIRLRSRKDKVAYDQWSKEGWLIATPGDAVDHEAIRKKIHELGETFIIEQIAADAWNAHKLLTELAEDGFEVVRVSQGFGAMTSPCKELDALYRGGRLRHAGHPVLRWMANNVALDKDPYDNWKPNKKKSSERIDGIVALVMALGRALLTRGQDDFSDGIATT